MSSGHGGGAGSHGRPVIFFDIAIGETNVGRIKCELFSDVTPKYVQYMLKQNRREL